MRWNPPVSSCRCAVLCGGRVVRGTQFVFKVVLERCFEVVLDFPNSFECYPIVLIFPRFFVFNFSGDLRGD